MKYKETKLIVYLNTFSKGEMNELDKYLSSPYFKRNRDPLPLFKVLKKHHQDLKSDSFNEKIIFNELYPGTDFSDKKAQNNFRSISSYLLKSVEEFIFISEIRNNNILKNRTMLESLLDKNLLKYYEQYLPTAYKDLKDHEKLWGQDEIEHILLGNINSRYYSLKRDLKSYLEKNFENTEITSSFFLINLLRSAKTKFLTETFNDIKTGNTSIDVYLNSIDMEKIIDVFKGAPVYVNICFNYLVYLSLINNYDKEFYKKAKKLFFENKSGINRKDLNYYYSDLMNIIDVHRKSDNEKNKEFFSIMVSCLDDKAYKISEDDYMQPDFYRNVILFSNRLKRFNWADKFVNEYTNELQPELRDNMMFYSKAVICYGRGEFEKSLDHISKIKYDLVGFKTDVKIFMLRIYYELDMTDQIYSLIDTFKHFIKNSKHMSKDVKDIFSNYLKYFQKIYKIRSLYDKNESGLLRKNLLKEILVCERNWLLEKLDKIDLDNNK
ncbi:MAG: hypothetical protein KBF96_01915 [Ignavibacteria bacterium]|jgi:hypothetical protein|nr:hypothetical protein [Ignavibacteria bacterium]